MMRTYRSMLMARIEKTLELAATPKWASNICH